MRVRFFWWRLYISRRTRWRLPIRRTQRSSCSCLYCRISCNIWGYTLWRSRVLDFRRRRK